MDCQTLSGNFDQELMLDAMQQKWPRLRTLTTEGMSRVNLLTLARSRKGTTLVEFHFGQEFVAALARDYPETLDSVRALGMEVQTCVSYESRSELWHLWDDKWAQEHEGESELCPVYTADSDD